MISQQSHPRQLSGNNAILLLICWCLLISCASSNSGSSGTKVLPPNHDKPVVKKEEIIPVDTIQWTVASEEEKPPITSDDAKVGSYMLEKIKKEHYKIALMLPMRLEEGMTLPELNANNKKFADFYAGIKLAAQEVDAVSVTVKTYYTNREEATLDEILSDMDRDRPDLIIGSYESSILSKTADWAKNNRVPLIAPWGSSTKITSDNLFYLQLRPGTVSYYKKISEHINDNFDRDKVYIIGRDERSDQTMKRVLQQINESNSLVPEVTAYNDLIVPLDSLMNADSVFANVLEAGAQAFILPHYSSRDESYVYSVLRKLYAEQGEYDFYIYSMPLILNSDRIDVNILKNLKTRTPEFRFPDKRNPVVQKFRENFYRSNGWLPTDDAYYGYDVMSFVLYGLENYGQYFHYYMQDKPLDLMQMKINVQPYRKSEDTERPDFLVNDHLYIIEYINDHFDINDIR